MPHLSHGRRNLLAAAASLSAAVLTATVLLPIVGAQAAAGCTANYVASTWPGGMTTSITIRNLGEPINGWTLAFAFPDPGQRVVMGWGATWTQSGAEVNATSLAFNAHLPTGGATSIGFQGSWTTSNLDPRSFTLNGAVCPGSPIPSNPPTGAPSSNPPSSPAPSHSASQSPSHLPSPSMSPSPSPSLGCPPMTDPPDWAARQWPLVTAVEDLDAAAQGHYGFTSFTMSPVDCRVDVYWKGSIPAAVEEVVDRYDGPITIGVHENAPYSKAELDPLADRLFADPALAQAAGVELISATWPAEGTGLTGGVPPTTPEPALAAAEAFLGQELDVPVDLRFDAPGPDFGRHNDTRPWYAGGRLTVEQGGGKRDNECSVGWVVKGIDARYMLTAAHCATDVGQKAFNGDKSQRLGSVAGRETTLDSAIVQVPEGDAKVFNDRPRSGLAIPVEKKTKVVKGQIVYSSGAYTGQNIDVEVFDPNYRYTDGNGWKIAAAVRAKQKDGKIAGGPGDSGGPVYVPTKDKGKAWAAGIIKGADPDYKVVPCRRDDETNNCGDSMVFIPIESLLGKWIVQLMTE